MLAGPENNIGLEFDCMGCRVVLTQPITALAFVWDGILYGVKGFTFAAQAMVACAAPSAAVMLLALRSQGNPEMQINLIWAGLALVMSLRTLTIYLPFRARTYPFQDLFAGKSK